MLKSRFAPVVAIALSAAVAIAQQPATTTGSKPDATKVKATASELTPPKPAPVRARRVIARSTPVPVATPVPKKLGFWERIFGKKKPTATPVPATPTSKAAAKKRTVTKKRTLPSNPAAIESAGANQEPGGTEPGNPTDDSATPPKMEEKVKPSTPKPVKPKGSAKRGQDFPPSTDNADAEIVERQKYEQAKAKAVDDPAVKELRGKADLAASEEESRKALRAYNKAMFKRIKESDPSIKDYVERMEAAVMSRLGNE